MIAVDSLRADHLSSYGYDRDTTPNLDSLAREAVLFEQAFSTAPWGLPAHVSILTGCDPNIARRVLPTDFVPTLMMAWNIPEEVPRLAKELLRRGFATAAFLDHAQVGPAYGFAAGFEEFLAVNASSTRLEDQGLSGNGRRFLSWVGNRSREEDWFAYLHLHDLGRVWLRRDAKWDTFFEPRAEMAHVPPVAEAPRAFYAIPRDRWMGGVRTLGDYEAQYDGALRQLDGELGRVFAQLQKSGHWENTTVVIVGTYGVGFGEAGLILDSGTLSDVDLHVPLIVRPAASIPFERGLRTKALVSLLDLAPTLLDLAGYEVAPSMHGVSLLPLLRAEKESVRTFALASCGLRKGYVVMDERYCLEETWPAVSDFPDLVTSWYGKTPEDQDEVWIALHDRWSSSYPGHIETPHPPEVVAQRLRQQAFGWIDSILKARQLYQSLNLFADREDLQERIGLVRPGSPGIEQ